VLSVRAVWVLPGLALAGVVVFLGLVAWGQRRLIYFPSTRLVPPAAGAAPGASDVAFRADDGVELRGWFFPAPAGRATSVLVLNGNAGSRESRLPLARAFTERGFSVLLFDYRGYGGNPGAPSEQGLIADARAARAYLASRPDVSAGRIVYFGESLGAAVAVALAAEAPPAALVLRSPFTSLEDVGRYHYPLLPVRLLLRDRYPSLERIAGIDAPLLVLAGDRDSIVPHAQSRRLFEAAPPAVKRFVSLPGADHNDPRLSHGAEVVERVAEFLAEVP
jgi:fermentation-respiration switch protein FrsA (DUF1100 family)